MTFSFLRGASSSPCAPPVPSPPPLPSSGDIGTTRTWTAWSGDTCYTMSHSVTQHHTASHIHCQECHTVVLVTGSISLMYKNLYSVTLIPQLVLGVSVTGCYKQHTDTMCHLQSVFYILMLLVTLSATLLQRVTYLAPDVGLSPLGPVGRNPRRAQSSISCSRAVRRISLLRPFRPFGAGGLEEPPGEQREKERERIHQLVAQ